MPRTLRLWVGAAALPLYLGAGVSASAQNTDIVTIYQNFIASRVAADECHALDRALDQRFQSNLMGVTIRASEAVKQRNASYTDQQLVDAMSVMANRVRQAVTTAVERNGCDNAGVQRLVQLYRMHGTMTLP